MLIRPPHIGNAKGIGVGIYILSLLGYKLYQHPRLLLPSIYAVFRSCSAYSPFPLPDISRELEVGYCKESAGGFAIGSAVR